MNMLPQFSKPYCKVFGLLIAMVFSIQVVSAQPAPMVSENSLGMKFVRIPAGEFFMGSD